MELPKKYNYKDIETKAKQKWSDEDTYAPASNTGDGKVFSVDTPPPTVSGTMHMGHAFGYSQGDFIVRYKRMKGFKVFYPFGTDDNGIPTEHLIEKKKKVRSLSMPRSEFVELCTKTLEEIKPTFTQAWIDLGCSCDFKNSYSTIDKDSMRVSQAAFLDLYEKGHIHRHVSPVAWSVKSQTAVAQAEFENIEKQSLFNDIAFSDANGNELIIATTRPELIPACVALAAHPDDERYAKLKGTKAKVPLFNYEVPIIYDKDVAKDKGTGLMMVCTFGDKEDIEKWYKHKLELRELFTKQGRLTALGQKYEGMKIEEARSAILEDLKAEGFLKNQKQIVHNTNVYERDGQPIEFMVTPQWFVKVLENKERLIKAADDITWHPEFMKVRYINWVEGLSWDWCISRQRHFGIPFPVWYEKDTGKAIVAKKEDLPIDPAKETPSWYPHPENLIPEIDVMDTWATSSESPAIALDRENDPDIKKEMPMTLRLQSHDIIRTWAFYTITKSILSRNEVPWYNAMIGGFVLDPQGKKMSKSKGNTIDPLLHIEKYGADAVRYGASSVKLGEDMPFMEKYLETGKKTCTKIFNASKFVHMHLEDYSNHEFDTSKLEAIDKWLIHKLSEAIATASSYLEEYEFAKARAAIDKFFWQHLCDYYLEMVKDRLYKPEIHGEESRKAGQMTLYEVLLNTLKLYAPYVPFITEEVYSWYFKEHVGTPSIHNTQWPTLNESFATENANGDLACEVIARVRKYKSEQQVSQKAEIATLVINAKQKVLDGLETLENMLKVTLSVETITYNATSDEELSVSITMKS